MSLPRGVEVGELGRKRRSAIGAERPGPPQAGEAFDRGRASGFRSSPMPELAIAGLLVDCHRADIGNGGAVRARGDHAAETADAPFFPLVPSGSGCAQA